MYSFSKYLPFYKRNLKLATPVMITQAGQVVVQLADNIMVGHVGTAELAGVSFANSIFVIGLITLLSFSQGLIPLVGHSVGSGNHEEGAKYLSNSLILNFIIYTFVGLLLLGAGGLMPFMGQETEVVFFAKEYYFINLISILPMALFFTSRFFAEGVGNTKYAMWVTIISNIVNIVLNWILIYGKLGLPALGVQGAALATLLSRIFCAIVFAVLFFVANDLKDYTLRAIHIRPDKNTFKELFNISLPIALTGTMESTAFCLFAVIMVGWIGKVELATHQIVQSLGNLSFMVATGIGAAATIRVAHQMGAGKKEEARMAGIASIHMSLAYMGGCGLLFVLLRHHLPYIFTEDPLVIEAAQKLIIALGLYQIFDAIQLTSIASLRGLKDTKIPMVIAGISYYLISVPTGYILAFPCGIGLNGVWYGLAIGLAFAAVVSFTRFIRFKTWQE